jgi:signal transduction histidine kinase
MVSVRQRFAWRAEAEGRPIVLDVSADVVLDADRVRLEQALANLVENALRHGAGTVTLTAAAEHGVVELGVHDEGNGFPPEFLARAFARFSRADATRRDEGAGLGLTIVQAIAHAHRGHATAHNHPSGGADVAVRLPISIADPPVVPRPYAPEAVLDR